MQKDDDFIHVTGKWRITETVGKEDMKGTAGIIRFLGVLALSF